MTSTLEALKASNQSRSQEQKLASERQKDCLVLILDHLRSCGYHASSTHLVTEAPVLQRYDVADNISLAQILREYEELKEIKFGRKPTFSKRTNGENESGGNAASNTAGSRKKQAAAARRRLSQQYGPGPTPSSSQSDQDKPVAESGVLNSVHSRLLGDSHSDDLHISTTNGITGRALPLASQSSEAKDGSGAPPPSDGIVNPKDRLLKPLPSFGGDTDLRNLASTIQRDIIQTSTGVSWDDIVELHEAKRLLKEAVVTPLLYPQLFTGLLSPWCGVLLYGPPGVGKTMLAKAVAAQSHTTFFNISASSIVSKFRGDSEKLVRVLFELARYHGPSTIFLDEIDSIMGHRSSSSGGGGEGSGGGGSVGEHEGSRRMKTELLIQMDGLSRGDEGGHGHVLVLAASNLPWDLDPALLRRLEKRVLVPLPDVGARREMLEAHFAKFPTSHVCRSEDLDMCAEATCGYSGADIKLLCKEAAMRPVRRILAELENVKACSSSAVAVAARSSSCAVLPPDLTGLLKKNPVTPVDLEASLVTTNKSSGSDLCDRYARWTDEFGST